MSDFEEYRNRFKTIAMERRDGILELTFHSRGESLQWSALPHREWAEAFRKVGDDPENKVIIMTGTGDTFSGPPGSRETSPIVSPAEWEHIRWTGYRLIMSLLDVEAPVIGVINGPAWRHAEVPLLADIVLASDDAVIQDSGHFVNNIVPGDGMHIVMPLLLGPSRAKYFLLTGESLMSFEAKELGIVHEVLPREELLQRARELAEQLARRPSVVLRYTRILLTDQTRRLAREMLGYGLALEGLGVVTEWVSQQQGAAPGGNAD